MRSDELIHILDADGVPVCSNCRLEFSRYRDPANVAIRAVCTEKSRYLRGDDEECPEGDIWGTLTVNLHRYYGDDVLIKDYSEGAGNLRTLQEAGIVGQPKTWVRSGFAVIPLCELTDKGRRMLERATRRVETENETQDTTDA